MALNYIQKLSTLFTEDILPIGNNQTKRGRHGTHLKKCSLLHKTCKAGVNVLIQHYVHHTDPLTHQEPLEFSLYLEIVILCQEEGVQTEPLNTSMPAKKISSKLQLVYIFMHIYLHREGVNQCYITNIKPSSGWLKAAYDYHLQQRLSPKCPWYMLKIRYKYARVVQCRVIEPTLKASLGCLVRRMATNRSTDRITEHLVVL